MKEISDTFLACLGISNTIILLCILIIIAKYVKQIMIDSSYPIVLVLLSNVASSICKSSIASIYGLVSTIIVYLIELVILIYSIIQLNKYLKIAKKLKERKLIEKIMMYFWTKNISNDSKYYKEYCKKI